MTFDLVTVEAFLAKTRTNKPPHTRSAACVLRDWYLTDSSGSGALLCRVSFVVARPLHVCVAEFLTVRPLSISQRLGISERFLSPSTMRCLVSIA